MGKDVVKGGGWRFSTRVVLPVAVAVGITVASVAGFVMWSAAKSDDRALQRQTHLVGRVIEQTVTSLAEQQDYHSNWDEAITALAEGDMEWFDANLASDLFGVASFDRIYVLDPAGQPLYAMYGGGKTNAERFEADRPTVDPMVEKLRAIDEAGALAAYDAGNSETVPNVTEISAIDGRPAYVGVSAIMSESGEEELEQVPGKESFLVAVRFLDGALTADFSGQYFIDAPVFSLATPVETGVGRHELKNASGAVVGWFSWKPDRPGTLILEETLPAMGGALAIAVGVIVLLLRSLRRTTAALEEGKARAEYQANHDALTGLANRAHFNKRLEEALGTPAAGGKGLALLALDLDRFKQVNDTMGHEAGDQLLREVGQRLAPLVNEDDTVARLGGDEFAIIQRGVTAPGEVSALSGRIIAALGQPFVLSGRVAQIGVSIGIVITPASKVARDLASKADIALYEAKNAGRNTFRIFDDRMQDAQGYRDKVADELKASGLPVQRVA